MNPPRHHSSLRHGLLIVAAALGAYLNSLSNGFTYDDVAIVVRNPVLSSEQAWWRPWVEPYWAESNKGDAIDVLYRPAAVQTYGLQRRLFGLNPFPFHVTNVLLHAAVSLAVCAVARRLGLHAIAALFSGLLFAVHPIHVEAVANIVGRAELLSALGLLCAVLVDDARFQLERSPARHTARYTLLTVLFVLCLALAMFSKETGAAAVVVVAAWRLRREWIERSDSARSVNTRTANVWHVAASVGLRALLPGLVVLGVYLWARYEVCAHRLVVGGQRAGPGNFLRETDAVARFWSPWMVLGRYLALMFYPQRLLCDYSLNVLLPVRTMLERYTALGVGAAAAMAVGTVRSLRRGGVFALLALGFATAYAVPSNAIVRIDVIVAERLFYAPSIWICLMLAMVLEAVARSAEHWQPMTRTALRWSVVVALAALAARTALRNPAWSDTETLLKCDLAETAPPRRSAHICASVASTMLKAGDLPAAEGLLREAIGYYQDAPGMYAQLAEVFERGNRLGEAVAAWERAVELAPNNLEFVRALDHTRRRAEGVDQDEELRLARAALDAEPNNPEALRRWARANESDHPSTAEQAYQELVRLSPNDVEAWKGLAYVLVTLDRRAEAIAAYRRAIDVAPEDWEAHTNLAVQMIDRTDEATFNPTQAVEHARRAVELNPGHWNVQVNLAEVLGHCGHEAEAAALFESLADQSDAGSVQQRMYRDRAAALRR